MPVATPKSESASNTSPRSVLLPAAQKQFLTIEAVGASQAVDVLALPGRVTFRPQAQSAVGATAAGRVVAVLVQAGQVVKAGAPLLTIDSADACGRAPRSSRQPPGWQPPRAFTGAIS